jgi:hypothetical protein
LRRTTITAALATGLLLTACAGSDGDNAARPSVISRTTTGPATEEPATSDEGAAKGAEEDFEKTLDDLKDTLGETLGLQAGTYEVTKWGPDYDDPSLSLDDEYIAPGTYTTKGPATQVASCYWARMRDASGEIGSIIANDLATGRAIVTMAEGEFFKTFGCKPWTRSGD